MARLMSENVLTFEEARAIVLQHAKRPARTTGEPLSLAEAQGRVLFEDILADRDYPPFPRATRDGYAVRAADLQSLPASVRVLGQVKAGELASNEVTAGSCIEIMTGAAVPVGADAVVMVEFTAAHNDRVTISRGIVAGENVVARGAEGKRGERVLSAGVRLRPQEIAVCASVGRAQVEVFARPTIAILSTGDEVIDIEQAPGPVQIRNSNAHSLAAQVRAAGGEARILPIAPDEKTRLRDRIEEGLASDLLLLSGGVSMGKYDLVEQVLTEFGAEFLFTGVKIQPGKPLVFGRMRDRYFFGLPGNPVSTMVTFELFARAVVDALSGASPAELPFVHARLATEVRTRTGLTRFLPASVSHIAHGSTVALVPWNGSGDVFAQARANCLLVVPPERERIPAGEWVTILPM